MIIDFHSHNFPDSIAARAIAGLYDATHRRVCPVGDGTLENQLDHMTHAGVDKAVLCSIATKPSQFEPILRRSLAIMTGACGARAQRMIIPFASIHPLDPDWSSHLEAVANAGIKGIKFHPYYQNFKLDDPAVWPIFRKIAELGLVVECHAGADLGYLDRKDACGPVQIATLLRNVRGLTFVAAHMGGCAGYAPHTTDDLLELGCYIDTSSIVLNQFHDEEMRLLRSWPSDRILFATDFPWTSYSESLAWVKSIREPADLPALLGGNACRLLS